MNLLHGEIAEIFEEDGMRMGRIRVGRALKKVPLDLLTDARCGDTVLLCDGVAINKVAPAAAENENDVPGDSRKTD
ncbi:MAG: HypC/HybG/HupF family hydrogenase formation chaperone [Chthoniobacterales bacterium]